MFKILTKNGVENTNIDGARLNRFFAGGKSGVIAEAFNEASLLTLTSTALSLNTCELLISGHRIIIDSPEILYVTNKPSSAKSLFFIAQLSVTSDSLPVFSLILQDESVPLIQDNLFMDSSGSGTYQMILCSVQQNTDGTLSNLVRKVERLTGTNEVDITGASYINIGEVVTNVISGETPSVSIQNVVNEQGEIQTNFYFSFPESTGGEVSQEDFQNLSDQLLSEVYNRKKADDNLQQEISKKLSNTYSASEAGKVLTVNPDGSVVPKEVPSGSNFDLLPIQILGYNGGSYVNEYSFTDIGNGIRRARVLCSIGGVYCSYGGMHIQTYSCENPTFSGDLRISVSSIPVHSIENYNSYSYGDVVEARMDEGFTLSFYVMDSASTYYIPAHDWYVEIEHDTNQNILLVRAFECDNY